MFCRSCHPACVELKVTLCTQMDSSELQDVEEVGCVSTMNFFSILVVTKVPISW